ncbi:MAG: thermopsin family protease [Nitrososphaerota archaeon]|nr:thermopsin family protease [Nitrososphaerota archaeon]
MPTLKEEGKGRLAVLSFLLVFSMLAAQLPPPAVATRGPPAPKLPGTSATSVPLTQSFTLRRGYYQNVEIDSFSNKSVLQYSVSSDVPISVAVMTSAQYNLFASDPNDPISNSMTYQNGTSVENTVALPMGQFYMLFYAYLYRASVELGYSLHPSTPFSYGPVAPPPLASGIASFGIYNDSGVAVPYEVRTGRIAGVANISALQVNTPNAFRYGVNVAGATLQLNAVLVVADNGSSVQKDYWVQNTPDFVTSASKVSFGDEIWNSTDLSGFLSNQTVTSTNFLKGGFVSPTNPNSPGKGYVYDYSPSNNTYALPLRIGLLVNAAVLQKTGVMVQFGYRLLSNGTAVSSPTRWFDNVTIHDSSIQAAYFDVNGNSTTPVGDYYDAELVFAGEANLETAHFAQLNSTLGLFYQNATSPSLVSFPSYYGFSGNTGEAADNLVVTYANGIAQLAPGPAPNYSYLGSASLALDPSTLHASPASTGQTTGTTSTSTSLTSTSSSGTTTASGGSSTSSTATSSLTSETPSGSTSSAETTGFFLGVGSTVLVFAVIVAAFMALRRRRPPAASPPPPAVPF